MLHLSQAAVARRMGVRQQVVARLESGAGTGLTLPQLQRWAVALGLGVKIHFPPGRSGPPTLLPRSLARYFWDASRHTISPTRHAPYVIERLLEYGDRRALGWLRHTYPRGFLSQVVRHSRGLSPSARSLGRLL